MIVPLHKGHPVVLRAGKDVSPSPVMEIDWLAVRQVNSKFEVPFPLCITLRKQDFFVGLDDFPGNAICLCISVPQ